MENTMLYKKNVEPRLSDELFKNPTSEYRGTPFWSWNCELDKDELCRQIDCLHEMGFGGYHMHCRTGMATPYLTEEFFDLVSACVEKGKENGMLSWLYDEDRWPSGSAGGKVTRNAPELRQRYMTVENELPDGLSDRETAVKEGGSYLIAAFDIYQNEIGELVSYEKVDANAPSGDGAERRYFVCRSAGASPWYNGAYYIDTLNPDAAKEFLRVTYDAYRDHFGDEFGKSVPAIFTDEPQFSKKNPLAFSKAQGRASFPWTPRFPEVFLEHYGYDIVEKLPEIIYELPESAPSHARYAYHDNIAEMFARGFNDVCGKWCEANGIDFTGHLMEEPTLESQTHSVGDTMRCYRNMQLPGIDMLCNRVELTTAKQTQSAVHQYGREGMTSELYGVTNWDYDFRGHKFQGDWQAALGVTVRVHHLSWVSMQGDAKRDYPASINYQSPWYKEYRYVEDHFARVNTALTRGKPIVKVAVVHPVESYWLRFGPNDLTADAKTQLEENFTNITSWLLSGLIDFNYICESTLPDQFIKSEKGLKVGEMTYDTVIIPACETLRKTTVDILTDFASHGGKLIFVGDDPMYIDAQPSDKLTDFCSLGKHIPFSKTSVLRALSDERDITVKNSNGTSADNFVYALRGDNGCKWLFLARINKNNCLDVSHPQRITVRIKGEHTPVLYDTITGEINTIDYYYENGSTVIPTVLYMYDSLLLRLDETKTEPATRIVHHSRPEHIATIDYKSRVNFTLSEPNVLLLDMALYAADDEPYSEHEDEILRAENTVRNKVGLGNRISRPVQPYMIEKAVPTHKIRLLYTVNSEIEYEGALLATEMPEVAEICFNGEAVDKTEVGYFTDKSIKTLRLPTIRQGANKLEMVLPLGDRTATEWCYILGDFGVRLEGTQKTVTSPADKLGFGSVTDAKMPFYSGNVDYHLAFTAPEACKGKIKVNGYRGAAVRVTLDGEKSGIIAYEPYEFDFGELTAGEHSVTVTLYGTRHNSFGALHDANYSDDWYGEDRWRSRGEAWCYEYKIRDMGVMTSPVITLYK